MDALAPYRRVVFHIDQNGQQVRKHVPCCPVCETQESLREAKGMILCTHCFWAMDLKQQAG